MNAKLTIMATAALCLAQSACGPGKQAEEPAAAEPVQETADDPEDQPKPHVAVPPLSSYSWLSTANIEIARAKDEAAMEAALQDFHSGLPTFMKVLAMATRDRSVALKDNPAYLTDIWSKYLSAVKRSPEDPPTALEDFDLGMCKWAMFSAWKIENAYTGVDNYDDAVTSVSYPK